MTNQEFNNYKSLIMSRIDEESIKNLIEKTQSKLELDKFIDGLIEEGKLPVDTRTFMILDIKKDLYVPKKGHPDKEESFDSERYLTDKKFREFIDAKGIVKEGKMYISNRKTKK